MKYPNFAMSFADNSQLVLNKTIVKYKNPYEELPFNLDRYNLGFGKLGFPEQCNNGKYCKFDEVNEIYKQSLIKNATLMVEHLEFKKKVEDYIIYKDNKITVCVWIVLGLLTVELGRIIF